MARDTRIGQIKSFLFTFKSRCPRLSEAKFKKEAKGILSPKEASLVFDYLDQHRKFKSAGSAGGRIVLWNCDQDAFDIEFTTRMFDELDLKDSIDIRDGKHRATPKKENPPLPKQTLPEKSVDLSRISTEDLAAELASRGWCITYGVV